MQKIYSPEVETIRQQLACELKKMLPITNQKVAITTEGKIYSSTEAEKSGFYIGDSVDSLSLSDLALLIDNKM